MAENYIPQEDPNFDIFQENLLTYINAHVPGTATPWGYIQSRVNTINTKQNRWIAAWNIAKNEASRNQGDVTEKDDARLDFEKDIRLFVREWLKNNELVSNQQRTLMGIPNNDTEPSPSPVPQTHPIIVTVDFSQPLTHKVNFRDQTATSKSKPFGVAYAEIKYIVRLLDSPSSVEDCTLSVMPTKTPVTITFPPGSSTKYCFYFLRWINTKGQPGAWSPRQYFLIS